MGKAFLNFKMFRQRYVVKLGLVVEVRPSFILCIPRSLSLRLHFLDTLLTPYPCETTLSLFLE